MKLGNRLISLLLAVIIVCSMIPVPTHAATGTAISTKEQLNSVRNDLSGSYYLANDIVFTADDFAEGGAFYNDGAGWIPIGTADAPFTGTFDGAGYGIKGLTINYTATATANVGLFGVCSGGTIENVTLSGGAVAATGPNGSKTLYVGGVVGRLVDGTVMNCVNTNAMNVATGYYSTYIGGIVGELSGAEDTGLISGCTNSGILTVTTAGSGLVSRSVGGIVGQIDDDYADTEANQVQNCTNNGNITATGNISYTQYYVGGIAGTNYGFMSNCKNNGAISVPSTKQVNIGGVIGGNWGQLSGCGNTGAVSTGCQYSVSMGGITGSNINPSRQNWQSLLTGCYNSGSVTVDVVATSDEHLHFDIGGISGTNRGHITNSYNVATVSVTVDSTAQSNYDPVCYLGGIAGWNDFARGQGINEITACYNAGAVEVNVECAYSATCYTGGIAGLNDGGTVQDCFNISDITHNVQSEWAVTYVATGGLVGDHSTNADNTSTFISSLSNSYNVGNVSGECTTSQSTYLGGVTGWTDATVTSCYYLNSAASAGIGNAAAGEATACTESQMTQQATFSGFDFTNVWTMDGNSSYLYPELKGVTMNPPKTVTEIYVSHSPIINYYVGDTFDPTYGKVTVVYSDGSTQTVDMTAEMVTGFNGNSAGTQDLKVSYAGKITYFTVTVNPLELTSIAVYKNPTKTTYVLGETVYADGGEIIAYYSNGTSKIISMTGGEVSVYGVTATKPGTQRMDVYYQGKVTYYYITYVAPTITGITVSTMPKTAYFKGDALDVTGGKITVHYNNNTTEVVDMTADMVSGFTTGTTGTKTLTVTYEGKTTTYQIKVSAVAITSIAVTTMPTKTTYYMGDTPSAEGGILTLYYNNGDTKTLSLTDPAVTVTFPVSYSAGQVAAVVTYNEFATRYNNIFLPVKLNSIRICQQPTKTTYALGETLDLAGGQLELTYNNGKTEQISLSLATATGFDSTTVGEKTVMLTYEGKQTQLKVTVVCTHDWNDATCDTPKTCSVCSATEGDALGHDWADADCDTPKTCSVCSATEGEALGHSWVDADCDTPKTCSVCSATEGDALGHSYGSWSTVKAATPVAEGEERRTCLNCSHYESRKLTYQGNAVILTGSLAKETTVYIDGLPYPVEGEGANRYVELPSDKETLMVTYTYHVGDAKDVHTQYPTGMKVYRVTKSGNTFTATHIPELDNLLRYSGSSIRITGKKGIRMITSLTQGNKSALTGSGLAGYTLVEYGTALCWASDLKTEADLTLGRSYTRSNYAYKKGVADPVFATSGNLTQYTNVLVGFTDQQCSPDIAMRPYIILQDAKGQQVTLYGGTVYRSVGYIAYQNRNVFSPGTDSYNYVWSIIHAVYGSKFDADFKG